MRSVLNKFDDVSVDKLSIAVTCRTCLKTDSEQQLTSIFDESSRQFDVFNQLLLLKIMIVRDERYPENICRVCMERLQSIDAFRRQCEAAQEYILEKYGNLHIDAIVECKKEDPELIVGDSKNGVESPKLNPADDDENEESESVYSDESSSEYIPDSEKCSVKKEAPEDDGINSNLKCPVCGKMFKTVAYKNDHVRLHSDVKAFSCNACDKSFKTRAYLGKHKSIVHTFGDHECDTCGMTFTKTSKYQSHMKSHNPTGRPRKTYNCSYCSKSFNHITHHKSHELSHTKNQSHLCNICGKGFIHDSSLKRHLKIHLNICKEDAEKYPCQICNKTYSKKSTLKAHIDAHLNIKPHQCEHCGMKFVQKGTLNEHMKIHTTVKTHHCEFCPVSFLRIRELRRHRLLIHNKAEAIVRQTDPVLPEKEEILKKEENDEPPKTLRKRPIEEKPYCCDMCGKSFTIPSSLSNHMKMHSKERRYVCKECGNGFNNIVNLKHHVKAIHMKQKPYGCEVCKKFFARVGDRNRHRKKHSADNAHQCTDCGKVFAWAMSLRAHIRIHTGERPFVCIICDLRFARQNYLARHTRSAHPGAHPNLPIDRNIIANKESE